GRKSPRHRPRFSRPRAGGRARRQHDIRAAPFRGGTDPRAAAGQPAWRCGDRRCAVTADVSPHLSSPHHSSPHIALLGNPNCGKTALFNLLTGSRQKVANYAGVTVERKEGTLTTPAGVKLRVLDLPGAYSFNAISADEAITRDVVLGTFAGEQRPDLIVCVTDATNLKLNLRLVIEAKRLQVPLLLALNMMDVARKRGIRIDVPALQRELGIPVVETIAIHSHGASQLLDSIDTYLKNAGPHTATVPQPWHAPSVSDVLSTQQEVRRVLAACVTAPPTTSLDDAIDHVAMHPVWGMLILAATLFLMFQAVFSWASLPMDLISASVDALGGWLLSVTSPGILQSLLVDGIIAGVGGVLVFLPQIVIL